MTGKQLDERTVAILNKLGNQGGEHPDADFVEFALGLAENPQSILAQRLADASTIEEILGVARDSICGSELAFQAFAKAVEVASTPDELNTILELNKVTDWDEITCRVRQKVNELSLKELEDAETYDNCLAFALRAPNSSESARKAFAKALALAKDSRECAHLFWVFYDEFFSYSTLSAEVIKKLDTLLEAEKTVVPSA